MVGYTVNGLMENRHRLLLGINVESFRGPASETDGGRELSIGFMRRTIVGFRPWARTRGILPSHS